MCDGMDLFQKQMSEPERLVSFVELASRYRLLNFIHNSVKYTPTEFCRVEKKLTWHTDHHV